MNSAATKVTLPKCKNDSFLSSTSDAALAQPDCVLGKFESRLIGTYEELEYKIWSIEKKKNTPMENVGDSTAALNISNGTRA